MRGYSDLNKLIYQCFISEKIVMAYVSDFSREYDKKGLFTYIACRPIEEVKDQEASSFFRKVDLNIEKGHFLGVMCSYDQGYHAFVFPDENVVKLNHETGELYVPSFLKKYNEQSYDFFIKQPAYYFDEKKDSMSYTEYKQKFEAIQSALEKGDSYQVNLTFKKKFNFEGSPLSLYYHLKQKQKVLYSFLAHIGQQEWILSFSPELFFKKNGKNISMKPMKGTSHPGKEDDLLNEKNKAENIMIVDLIRNDLGKVSQIGTVKVDQLFQRETYPTVSQMTSQISSVLQSETTTDQFFSAVFPSGSVTGTPKKRSMSIISLLESEKRGLYTGAIGYFLKDKSVFNVAIRTLVIREKQAEFGIGSGITYLSSPQSEYQESLSKSLFLNTNFPEFQLFETFFWTGSYLKRISDHLERLEKSANNFYFKFDRAVIVEEINHFVKSLPHHECRKVRLILSKEGAIQFESHPTHEIKVREVCFSKVRTHSQNIFLRHKTSFRDIYSYYSLIAQAHKLVDCIFLNEKGEVTEGTRSNVFYVKDDQWYTPCTQSGLLPGIERCSIIKHKGVLQKKVTKDDLWGADKVYLSNSCMGCIEVSVLDQEL